VLVSLCTVPPSATAARFGVRAKYGKPPAHKGAVLRRIAQLVDAGSVKPTVSMVFPLEEVREAHKRSHTGHVRGKIVLTVIGADS
jgi:NADPH:quinone reductase-like Zn-dependent oxidoreductase